MFFLTVKAFLYVLSQIEVIIKLLQRIIEAGEGNWPVGILTPYCVVISQWLAVSACCDIRGLHVVYPDEGRPEWDILPSSGCREEIVFFKSVTSPPCVMTSHTDLF